MWSAFLVVAAGDLESNGLAEHPLERADVPVGGPQLELGVAVGAETREVVVAPRIEVQPGECLSMTAVQSLRETDHRRQRFDGFP
jgi:hypothetical protein